MLRRRRRKERDRRWHDDLAYPLVLHAHQVTARQVLRVLEYFVDREYRTARHADFVAGGYGLRLAHGADPSSDRCVDLRASGEALGIGRIAIGCTELLPPHRASQAFEDFVAGARKGQPFAFVRLPMPVRYDMRDIRTEALAHFTEARIDRRQLVEQAKNRGIQRHVDHLSSTGLLCHAQRHEHTDGTPQTRDVVGKRGRSRNDGRPVRRARQVRQSGKTVRDPSEARLVAIGARLPVCADPQHDDGRFHGLEHVESEPPLFQGAWPEVLEHDIRHRDQAEKRLPSLGDP